MFRKKIPAYLLLIFTAVCITATYFITTSFSSTEKEAEVISSNDDCNYKNTRLSGYTFTRPLLYGDRSCESDRLSYIKNKVSELISTFKTSGSISNASVYMRVLNSSEWFQIGESEKYNPGSLLKVPELITFFRMNEKNPGLLNKKISYATPLSLKKQALFVSKHIEVGKTYTIRELLHYMIAYSDNEATMLLNQQMDLDIFKKVFTDLGMANPDMTKNDIPITIREYSLFLRVLFNASYLNIEESEFYTGLLSQSDFDKGLLNGLPKGTRAAHKFGAAGEGVNSHFSEAGIIYLDTNPYLITVMTKGRDPKALPAVVANISRTVFDLSRTL